MRLSWQRFPQPLCRLRAFRPSCSRAAVPMPAIKDRIELSEAERSIFDALLQANKQVGPVLRWCGACPLGAAVLTGHHWSSPGAGGALRTAEGKEQAACSLPGRRRTSSHSAPDSPRPPCPAAQAELGATLRCAGGWVRDKLMGRQSLDIDIALDNMLGKDFAERVNEYLKAHVSWLAGWGGA